MKLRGNILSHLTLLASFSTLFCCALPALFVALGAGAALLGLITAVPQLIWLSAHKIGLFIFAASMLTFSAVMRYLNRGAPCPIDPEEAELCRKLRRTSRRLFIFSLCTYATGFYFAFIAPHLE